MLTLNKLMPGVTCCIHIHIYRSSHPEGFFKKGALRLASLKQKCEFDSTEITPLYGYSSINMQHICSRTPLLENTSGELRLYTVFIIEVINVEALHKQVKYEAGKKPCLSLNVIFARPEAVIVGGWAIYRSLVSGLQSLCKTS